MRQQQRYKPEDSRSDASTAAGGGHSPSLFLCSFTERIQQCQVPKKLKSSKENVSRAQNVQLMTITVLLKSEIARAKLLGFTVKSKLLELCADTAVVIDLTLVRLYLFLVGLS